MTSPKPPTQPLQWVADDHGALSLYPEDGHVWIKARRTYCDRGHWDWGYTGLPMHEEGMGPEPSYYFLRLDTAVAEIEAWMAARLSGQHERVANTLAQHVGTFEQKDGQAAGWTWTLEGDSRLVAEAVGARAVLTLEDTQGAQAGVTLTMAGVESLDSADCFPRHYRSVARAVQEAEDFLAWRLLNVPAEIPGPIERLPQPVGDALQHAVGLLEPVAPRRSPAP